MNNLHPIFGKILRPYLDPGLKVRRQNALEACKSLRANWPEVYFAFHNYGDGPRAWMIVEPEPGTTDQDGAHIVAMGATRSDCLRQWLKRPYRNH